MTIGLSLNLDLARVQIALSNLPNGTVRVERSTNQLLWHTVRGGVALPIVAGAAALDDYEFAWDVENHYRLIGTSQEDKMDVFTSSGTWNKPAGLTAARVTVVGGHAGGGGAEATDVGEASAGSGGGYGAVAVSWLDASALGSTETVTVGDGGTGATAGANNGSSGGTSSFGSHVSASGGSAGQGGTATSGHAQVAGGSGGTSGTGQIVVPGARGEYGIIRSGTDQRRGDGASGLFGRGGTNTSADGDGANGDGGAGSGGRNASASNPGRAGGNGSAGLVVVEHFFWAET